MSRIKDKLGYSFKTYGGTTYMKITHGEYDILCDHGGPFTGARVVMSDIGQAYFQPDGGDKDMADGDVFQEPNLLDGLLDMLGKGWHYCSGIPMEAYSEHSKHIRYQPHQYTEEKKPVHTVRVQSCKRWFYVQWAKKNTFTGFISCPGCNSFFKRVCRLNKKSGISDTEKVARLNIQSLQNTHISTFHH